MLDRIDGVLGAFGALLDWSCGVIRSFLPDQLAHFGTRSVRRVVDVDAETGLVNRSVIATSLLGATRPVRSPDGVRTFGLVAVVAPDDQFRIVTELSDAAARAGRDAIALRLGTLSPIALDDAVFAYRRLTPAGTHPVQVEVAITRRSHVEATVHQLSRTQSDWRLVADMSEHDGPELELRRSGRQPMGLGLKLFLVAGAIAIALLAWSGRIDQAADDLQMARAELTVEARRAASDDLRLETVAAAHSSTLENPRIGSWLEALAGLAVDAEPFSAIRVSRQEVSLQRNGDPVARAVIADQTDTGPGGDDGEAAP